jgi:hypothetical protein
MRACLLLLRFDQTRLSGQTGETVSTQHATPTDITEKRTIPGDTTRGVTNMRPAAERRPARRGSGTVIAHVLEMRFESFMLLALSTSTAFAQSACTARVDAGSTRAPDAAQEAGSASASPPGANGCPAETPVEGASCAGERVCGYAPCEGVASVEARCEGGAWALLRVRCEPKGGECPAAPPTVGDPCAVDGTRCSYAEGDAEAFVVNCVGREWRATDGGSVDPDAGR